METTSHRAQYSPPSNHQSQQQQHQQQQQHDRHHRHRSADSISSASWTINEFRSFYEEEQLELKRRIDLELERFEANIVRKLSELEHLERFTERRTMKEMVYGGGSGFAKSSSRGGLLLDEYRFPGTTDPASLNEPISSSIMSISNEGGGSGVSKQHHRVHWKSDDAIFGGGGGVSGKTEDFGQYIRRPPYSKLKPPSQSQYRNEAGLEGILPPAQLSEFSGNYMEFMDWFDGFNLYVHSQDIRPEMKMNALVRCLTGKPALLVKGMGPEDYDSAMAILTKEYGDPLIQQKILIEALDSLEMVRSDGRNLDAFITEVRRLSHALKRVGAPKELISATNLLRKLPTDMRATVMIAEDIRKSSVSPASVAYRFTLENFIDHLHCLLPEPQYQKLPEKLRSTNLGSSLTSKSLSRGVRCMICETEHPVSMFAKCSKPEERWRRIERDRLCSICLSPSHPDRQCPHLQRPCQLCQKTGHHESVCARLNNNRSQK